MINSRLAVAIHILSLIALNPKEQYFSEFIPSSVNTNPAVIRRFSGMLKKAGLLSSQVAYYRQNHEIIEKDIFDLNKEDMRKLNVVVNAFGAPAGQEHPLCRIRKIALIEAVNSKN